MKWANRFAAEIAGIFLLASAFVLPLSAMAAEDGEKARSQFESILEGINERSFTPVRSAIDRNDLTQRIYSIQGADAEVKKIFNDNFWEIVEGAFLESVPNSASGVNGELIEFDFQQGTGQAVIRYRLPRYTYAYQIWALRHDSRQRLKIVDWYNSNNGLNFTSGVGEDLVTIMPSKAATRKLLSNPNATDRQLFQVTEILKAARDRQPPRFFEIYDDLDADMQSEAFIAKLAVQLAFLVQDGERFARTLEVFLEVYGSNPGFALMLADYLLIAEKYEAAYLSLQRFYESYRLPEGATPARLSALALAIGKDGDAEKYALEATTAEASLELGWWSLLRARASAADFKGATEALTRLEDDFGHRLDGAKLRRDRFRGFLELAQSQEFEEWRVSRE